MSRYEDELDQQFLEAPEEDLEMPDDGRDASPAEGSSDDPDSLDSMDPLRRDTYLVDGDEDQDGVPDYQQRGEYTEEDEAPTDNWGDDGQSVRNPEDPDGDWTPRDDVEQDVYRGEDG